MSSEYVVGTITGIIATAVGFVLSMLYERKRSKKIEYDNRKKTLSLLRSELEDNLTIAEENLELFASNIGNLPEKKTSILAPTLYHESSWHVARANGIMSMLDNESYKFVAETYITLGHMNTQFSARENFRINNMALSNYHNILMAYDTTLQEKSVLNIERIKKTVEKLREIQVKLSRVVKSPIFERRRRIC